MNVMADVLWNRNLAVKPHRNTVMEAAFGKYAEEVEAYLAHLVKTTRAGGASGHTVITDKGVGSAEQLSDLAAFAGKQAARFAKLAQSTKNDVLRTSLEIITVHAQHLAFLARARRAGLNQDAAALQALREEYEAALPAMLERTAPWIDPLLAGIVRRTLEDK